MDSDQNRYVMPEAVYFDTNVLWQLSHGVSNIVDFLELRNISKNIGVSFFAPEVVVKEWINRRKIETSKQIKKLAETVRSLGHLLGRKPLKYEEPKEVETTINRISMEYLDEAEIKMIPTPKNIQLETLIEMSIRKEAPFEEKGEKGFRDAVILFTIIEHLQANEFTNAILVSADRIFGDSAVVNRFKSEGLNILIAKDFDAAKEQIKAQMDIAAKFRFENKKQKIESFLRSKFDEISDYILKMQKFPNFLYEVMYILSLLRQKVCLNPQSRKY